MLMGEALDGLDRTAEAIREFQVAAEIAPRQPNVHFGLGYLYWKQLKFEDAELAFRRELSNDPAHAQSKAYLGDIFVRRNGFDEALPLLEEAVKLQPDLRIAHLDLGSIYTQQKQYEKAIAALKEAIRLDPNQADSHYRLAMTYRAMGRTEETEAVLEQLKQIHEKRREELLHKISRQPPTHIVKQ